ncbi:hypothetical protein HYH03_012086 [Edaphochlamys debaryana]|uniref:PRC-barrel domain-containing protein n=1 Tax=Edaphochlamys debaryana TaxID=47281 RepID=A0A835XTL0_9CHLO|nr:hypothetical protein HYH03_012086 [Edaphochlamys debaryana]|eukprot:KAG2489450.1 hypothetical protein HYH03_012086 [Edaphochlamys debaryana]
MGQQPPQQQPMALARRRIEPMQLQQQPIYLNLSQVSDKQVITRNKGTILGTIGEALIDPQRLEVVVFELESKRDVRSQLTGAVPLAALKEIGDVVLVQDDSMVLQDSRYYSNYGLIKLLGMDVKTRSGRVLGKVRDVAFSPDTGAVARIEFDDFGLRFLPPNFFDTFSVSAEVVESCAYGYVQLSTEDVYPRQEKQGILSSILKGISGGGPGGRPQLLLSDGSRGEAVAGYLPQGYSYAQWQNDVRRWEAETGMSYEDYMVQQQAAMMGGSGAPGGGMRALPPARGGAGAGPSGMGAGQGLPAPGQARYGGAAGAGPAGQQLPGPARRQAAAAPPGQQAGAYGAGGGGGYGAGGYGTDPRYRGPAGPQQPGQQQQPPAARPGYPGAAPPAQQAGWAQPPPAQQQGQTGWPAGPAQQRQAPPQGAPQQQQAPGGYPPPGRAPAGPSGAPGPQQPQAQYGWAPEQQPAAANGSGPDGAGGPGPNGSGPVNGSTVNGAAAAANGTGALRVDEWLAREGPGSGGERPLEVAGRQPAGQQRGVDGRGWEAAQNPARPY